MLVLYKQDKCQEVSSMLGKVVILKGQVLSIGQKETVFTWLMQLFHMIIIWLFYGIGGLITVAGPDGKSIRVMESALAAADSSPVATQRVGQSILLH